MNKELLIKVRDQIIAHNEQFNYEYWYLNFKDTDSRDVDDAKCHSYVKPAKELHDTNPCGTVACVAGWTVLLADPDLFEKIELSNNGIIEYQAKHVLGLSWNQADFLFRLDGLFNFPEKSLHQGTWKDAVERINYLLENFE